MAHAKNHDYHILPPSIWPLAGAVSAFVMLFGATLWMKGGSPWMGLIGFVGVLYVMFAWWSEVVHEGQTGDQPAAHEPAEAEPEQQICRGRGRRELIVDRLLKLI